nr:60S acidic ribosomal protein P1-like [Tanacetum cinerariifolium]
MQAEKIATILKEAYVQTESYWPSIFSKLADKKNIEDLIVNVGAGGGGAAPVIAALVAGGAADTEENKEEPEEESDDDMGLDLFGVFDLEEPEEESDDDMGLDLFG